MVFSAESKNSAFNTHFPHIYSITKIAVFPSCMRRALFLPKQRTENGEFQATSEQLEGKYFFA